MHARFFGSVSTALPVAQDAALATMARPVAVCADESCHDRASLAALVGRYDVVNIKLDKAGGLTEALALRDAARALGFGLMVGCMVGSSLALAPAVLLAQGADVAEPRRAAAVGRGPAGAAALRCCGRPPAGRRAVG